MFLRTCLLSILLVSCFGCPDSPDDPPPGSDGSADGAASDAGSSNGSSDGSSSDAGSSPPGSSDGSSSDAGSAPPGSSDGSSSDAGSSNGSSDGTTMDAGSISAACLIAETMGGCPECVDGEVTCTYGDISVTAWSCGGCQAEQGLYQALCTAGSPATADEIATGMICGSVVVDAGPGDGDAADAGAAEDADSGNICGTSNCGGCSPPCEATDTCVNGQWICGCNCPDIHECDTNSDCGTGTCASFFTGMDEIRYCRSEPNLWAHTCGGPNEGDCCQDSDCTGTGTAYCMAFSIGYCGGVQPQETNVCRYDECDTDSDCGTGQVCLASGAYGSVTRECIQAECTSHDDCGTGFCSLLYTSTTCPSVTLKCNTMASECHRAKACASGDLCVSDGSGGAECKQNMPPP